MGDDGSFPPRTALNATVQVCSLVFSFDRAQYTTTPKTSEIRFGNPHRSIPLFLSPVGLLAGRELGSRSQAGAEIPQGPDADDTAAQESTQDADTPSDAQVDVERVCVDDGARGQGRTAQIVRGKQTGRVLRVRQGQVHEDALE